MIIEFYKYQGAGNDFIMLDERQLQYDLSESQIAHLCHRHFGIGADGLIKLQVDNMSDFRMLYYNADGRESTMCGNGGRCIVQMAKDLELIQNETTFNAIDGEHQARIEGEIIHLQMQNVSNIDRGEDFYVLHTGSPHFVKFVDNIDVIDVVREGRNTRNSERFQKEGINVNFVEIVGENYLKIRTYERGVEDETWACGTGVVAASLSYAERLGLKKVQTKVVALGGKLEVQAEKRVDSYSNVWLSGPAKQVFKGQIEILS